MVRRSTPASKEDEQSFAVRIRFRIPDLGLRCLPELNAWLDQQAGRNNYAIHGASSTSRPMQSCFLHMHDPHLAAECIKTFDLEVLSTVKVSPMR